MIHLFLKGGPIMWPLLVASITTVAAVIERLIFLFRERRFRNTNDVEEILASIERRDLEQARRLGKDSKDFVARALTYALEHRDKPLTNALLRAAGLELKRFNRGLHLLDTIITLAPLLGLLGTVTGMIHAFGLLGANELGAPSAITGGIAEALIATAFGLGIAITALIPFNYLNARLEEARQELESAGSHLELLLLKEEANDSLDRRSDVPSVKAA